MQSQFAAPTIGEVVSAKYRIESVIGQGGMATVYAATHLELQERVALKFLKPEYTTSETVVARFLQEARAMFRLKSAHVGKVLDVGKHEGKPYIVLEMLVGETLEEMVQLGGPVAPDLAREIAIQACEGIAEAHALRIIHRDIKPMNLFVSRLPDGRPLVKVLDFGLSKVRREAANEASLTNKGDVMGTLRYMAPEQLLHSAEANELSDIFSIGAVLYRALTADFAITGSNDVELAAALMKHKPIRPIRDRQPGVPEELAAAAMRCLAFDPRKRFASVKELAAALRAQASIVDVSLAPVGLGAIDDAFLGNEDETMDEWNAPRADAAPPSSEATTRAMARPPVAFVDDSATPILQKRHLAEAPTEPSPGQSATLEMPKPAGFAALQHRTPADASPVAGPPRRQTARLTAPAAPAPPAAGGTAPPAPAVPPPRPSTPQMAPGPGGPPTVRPRRDDPTAVIRRPKKPPPLFLGIVAGALVAAVIVGIVLGLFALLK